MNKKEHYLEISKELLDKVSEMKDAKPQVSLRYKIKYHEVMTSIHLLDKSDSYLTEIENIINSYSELIEKHGQKITPESENKYAILCFVVNKINDARMFCSSDTTYSNSHNFDKLLNCKIRKILSLELIDKEPKYKPTAAEHVLFEALDNILTHKDVDYKLLSQYWKKTKTGRYQSTVFGVKDLFSIGISNLQNAYNRVTRTGERATNGSFNYKSQ